MTVAPPFVIFGLPRSRTAWLSRFLTYGDWICGHEELRHVRSLDDVRSWFLQPCVGTVETAGAPWWRMLEEFAPGIRIVLVRRSIADVIESLMRLNLDFDRELLTRLMTKLDHKLDQIEARTDCMSVNFEDLDNEATCASIFEHCLPYAHDHAHWERLAKINIQIDMRALMRYYQAYREQLDRIAAIATQRCRSAMMRRAPVAADGIVLQTETFDRWLQDAQPLFREHCSQVGESPDNWKNKNIELMRAIDKVGAMQIMTARCNGRMFGYLMTLLAPSLVSDRVTSATNTTFFASPEFPGLGMKLQRAALVELQKRGVNEVVWEAGKRGSGPRMGTMYRRLGAEEHGQVYRLQLTEEI